MFLTKEWIEEAFPDDHVLTTHRKDEIGRASVGKEC